MVRDAMGTCRWNQRDWESGREVNAKLEEYTKVVCVWGGGGGREKYINFAKGSNMLCKFRIGDMGLGKLCVRCVVKKWSSYGLIFWQTVVDWVEEKGGGRGRSRDQEIQDG